MSNTRHLKRTNMPTSWPIKRKNISFIKRPSPGSHKREYSVSMLILLKDILEYVENLKEARYAIKNTEVLVNGKKVDSVKLSVGLFDVIEFKSINEKYVVLFDTFGKIKLIKSKDETFVSKVISKSIMPGKKFQVNLFNGNNLLVDEKEFTKIKVNDSVEFDFKKGKISQVLPLKESSFIYIFDGKYVGRIGEIKEFVKYNGLGEDIVVFEVDGEVHSTALRYAYVVSLKKDGVKRFE